MTHKWFSDTIVKTVLTGSLLWSFKFVASFTAYYNYVGLTIVHLKDSEKYFS